MDKIFTVKWTPCIDGFFDFVKKYREIIGINLGGTRESNYKYNNSTIAKVLSVGPNDNLSSLPQRISLTNFDIGSPINSYGCICRYSGKTEPEYLLIKRYKSVDYIDLINGIYRESQLFLLIGDLPTDERKRILENDFDTLWRDLHRDPVIGEGYEYAQKRFAEISPHFPKLFEIVPSNDPNGLYLWLFPKGRPDYTMTDESKLISESQFDCALREFTEETDGLHLTEEDICFTDPVIERYLGSNSKNYQTTYFVFGIDGKPEAMKYNSNEAAEIKWVPLSKIEGYLRPARRDLIKYIEEKLSDPEYVRPSGVNGMWKLPMGTTDIFIENDFIRE